MVKPSRRRIFARSSLCLLPALPLLAASEVQAHVKWFCAFDVAGQPRGLENVLCPDFEMLVAFAIVVMMVTAFVERLWIGEAIQRALGSVLDPVRSNSDLIIRATCGFFFISLSTMGGIIMTPELKTTSTLIPCLQLAIAAGLLSRKTMVFSALGIVALFATALHDYGVFHLMDYPIFLGVAAYLALVGLDKQPFGIRPLDILRWAASITLMWASIEKWAYPEWTFPLLLTHPNLAMGLDGDFFMRAAGVVEFGLSFALIWTPLLRRTSALILAGMFIAAILEFGKIDAIGHSPIIAAMFVIAADEAKQVMSRRAAIIFAPVGFAGALVVFLGAYYVLHTVLFGTSIA